MTREQAVKRLRKLYGEKARWRVGETITSPERREAARAERDRLREEVVEVEEEIRRREVAAGIPELRALRTALAKARDEAGWRSAEKRFRVGYLDLGIAFYVKGEGDTWEEALAEAERKKS